MIWLFFILMIALALLFVWPVLNQPAPVDAEAALTRELDASRAQLQQIHDEIETGFQDEESAARARRAMERRILKLADKLEAVKSGKAGGAISPAIKFGVPAVILLGSAALYPFMGAPGYSREAATPQIPEIPAELRDKSLPELIADLEAKLSTMPEKDPNGYMILARGKMNMSDFEGAMAAYQIAYDASGEDERIAAEMEEARAFIANRTNASGPDLNSDAAEEIRNMTPEQQQARIAAMVDGLAARLESDPTDLQGWQRLIRARAVMGNIEQARTDIGTAKAAFEGDPAALEILSELENSLPVQGAE